MAEKRDRGRKASGPKLLSLNIADCAQQPEHLRSAFMLDEPQCFVVHRVGPSREYEKIYGPYHDKSKARSRMTEYVENFIRENSLYNPFVVFRPDLQSAKIEVEGMAAKGEGPAKHSFYFSIKPLMN